MDHEPPRLRTIRGPPTAYPAACPISTPRICPKPAWRFESRIRAILATATAASAFLFGTLGTGDGTRPSSCQRRDVRLEIIKHRKVWWLSSLPRAAPRAPSGFPRGLRRWEAAAMANRKAHSGAAARRRCAPPLPRTPETTFRSVGRGSTAAPQAQQQARCRLVRGRRGPEGRSAGREGNPEKKFNGGITHKNLRRHSQLS